MLYSDALIVSLYLYGVSKHCVGSPKQIGNAMRWNNVWQFPFYLVDFLVLAAALFCFIYFLRNRRFSLVRASHSNIDNGILIITCFFCLLPMLVFGEMSASKCLSQWLAQNVMYAIYSGLLFTKIPYFINAHSERKMAYEQAIHFDHINQEHPPTLPASQQRVVFPVLFVVLPIIIALVSIPFSDLPEVEYSKCSSREFMGQCPIQGNISVFTSIVYTWSLLLSLSVLALIENNRVEKCWKIPWTILVAFLSYTALICCSNLKLQCTYGSWFNLVLYLFILINPVVCLSFLYLPKLHLITTFSLHLKSFKKSSGNMRNGSSHFCRYSSNGEVIVNHSLYAGSCEGLHAGSNAGLHERSDCEITRPTSYVSDASSRIANVQNSIRIVSNLFRGREPGYKSLRRPLSLYDNVKLDDNVPQPISTWDKSTQSSLAISLASYDDSRSEDSLETEITLEELKWMTEFLKGLRCSDV